MLAKLLRACNRFTLFNKKKKSDNMFDGIEEILNKSENLGYLVERIKKNNADKPFLLPPQKPQHEGKLTVVMELDQVLAFTFTPDQEAYLLAPYRQYDFYHQFDEYDALLSIYKRKNLDNFLNYVSEECEPVLFSAGVGSYVDIVMNFIDPEKKIPYRLSQEHCDRLVKEEEEIDEFVKDFQLLGRDMSRVVYFDSKPFSYWMYPDNSFPLEEFRADQTMESQDMNWMIMELEKLRKMQDVRPELIKKFQIRKYLQDSKML